MIEENIKAMFDEHIQTVRLTNDQLADSYVYENQIETAKEIIYNLYTKNNQNRWCLLFAEMQSGKSGTFFSIPYIISRNKILIDKLGIDMFNNEINVFLLTGMNEKELIQQFEKDIFGFTGMDITKNVLHNSEMNKFLSKNESFWNSSDKVVIDRMRKNSLILIDESHYGSDKNQVLDKFLRNIININPNGDNGPLIDKNIYVVSISATPMAEFINANLSEFSKKIVPLKNAIGYYGISEMFKNSKIKDSYDLKSKSSVDNFLNCILQYNQNGYILVRCNKKQQDAIEKRIGERMLNIGKPIRYDQYHKSVFLDNMGVNEILDQTPTNKTIIFLKGLLRAGKRVNTKNVIMVHDTSVSKVDTTVQSLLGRCCGYGKNTDIDIYCDKLSAEKYKNWVESGYDIDMVPDKSKNIVTSGRKNLHINKIKILKYDLSPKYEKLYNKSRRTKNERKNIIEGHLNDELKNFKNYYIGSFYDFSGKKVKEAYESKDGYLCIGDMDKEFNKDFDNGNDPTNNFVITPLIDRINNKIEFSIGQIVHQEIQSSEKSMYHETNIL